MRDGDTEMRWFVLIAVVAVAGFGLLVWAMVSAETEAATYIAAHNCEMTERREGYYTTIYMQVGKVMVPNMIWNAPRGYFQCDTGEGRWIFLK